MASGSNQYAAKNKFSPGRGKGTKAKTRGEKLASKKKLQAAANKRVNSGETPF